MKPFFTVIIPTLNEEQFLPRLLSDLARQKKRNFVVIIIDGKSQDKTKTIIKSFMKQLPISFYEMSPNLSAQKNFGGFNAKTEYCIFLDADMSVSSTFTRDAEKQVRHKKGFIFQPYVFPLEKKEFPDIYFVFPLVNKLAEFSQNFNKPFSGGPAMIWEKSAFKQIGGFDDIFGEDHQIIRKAHRWGLRPKFLPSLRIKFSLRRMKKEGKFKLSYHTFITHLYLLFNERFKSDVFTYIMGGQIYNGEKRQENEQLFEIAVKKIKKAFKTFLLEE